MKFVVPLLLLMRCASQQATHLPLYPIIEDNRYGFIDQKGKVIIRAIFLNAGNFSEGLAPVRLDGTWGYINGQGEFVIAPQFDYGQEFHEGVAIVNKNGEEFYIDKQGMPLFENIYIQIQNFQKGRAIVQTRSGKFGIIDKQGKLLLDTVFRDLSLTPYGTYVVRGLNHRPESWKEVVHQYELGIIDANGKFLVPYGRYMEIHAYANGYAQVSVAYETGDTSGESSITGYIDSAGKFLHGRKYVDGEWVNGEAGEGSFQVQYSRTGEDGKRIEYTALVGMDGQAVLDDPRYESIHPFNSGRAFAEDADMDYWLIDRKGRLVVSKPFDEVLGKQFYDNIAFVRERSKWKAIDTNGVTVFPPLFDEIDEYAFIKDYFVFAETNKKNLYGIADMKGRIIIPASLQQVDSRGYVNGLLHAMIDNRLAYYDTTGKQVWIQNSMRNAQKDTLNIDYMNRGYFYASSPYNSKLAGFGGWGGSLNEARDISQLLFNNNRFEVYIDTKGKLTGNTPYPAYRVYVVNTGHDSLFFDAQDSRLYMNMQAKDSSGEWKDIEYLPSSWCGNSYHSLFLAPGKFWQFATPIYTGALKTELRLKLLYKEDYKQKEPKVIYSNVIRGGVNPGQFWRKQDYHPAGIMDPYFE